MDEENEMFDPEEVNITVPVEDCDYPLDQNEQLELAIKKNAMGNDHQAVKILIEVVRGLL